ncbi:DUF975 family protein [Candidatus Saccharibacteria bacterium]|nr:DUF975 family protein [Candidatus Saccharibacteria bacterium]
MDRVKIKQLAKQQIKGKVLTLFALSLLVGLVSGLCSLVPVAGAVASFLITSALVLSWSFIYLNVIRKNKAPIVEDLLYGFKNGNFLRAIVGAIYYGLFVFLWSLLFWIPGIIKSIAYSQMFFLMTDNPKMEAGEAQKKSMEMMNGHKMDYFILQLSFFPWFLLTIVTFGLAAIYVGPYMQASYAAFYDALLAKKSPLKAAMNARKEAKASAKKVKSAK